MAQRPRFIVVIPDGMADLPLESLGGRTPVEAAKTPGMDALAARARVGLTRNVPAGVEPGSDVAIMSIMGYDPGVYYSGRGPLEAAALGATPGPDETAFRCNLVTLKDGMMNDYCAGHITPAEAARIVETLNEELGDENTRFVPGVGFRALLLAKGDFKGGRTRAPHDNLDKPWEPVLPEGNGSERLIELIRASQKILESHPVNAERAANGRRPANSIWPWSGGPAPSFDTYADRFGISGAVVTAVDLVRGLGRLAGFETIDVDGATGLVDTNYAGKVAATLEALRTRDLAFLHVEGIDEAAHGADLELKIRGIERFDAEALRPLLEGLEALRPWVMLLLPDHPTPVALRTHTSDPVPFMVVDSEKALGPSKAGFTERLAAETGVIAEKGHELLPELLREYGVKKET